MVPTKTDEPSKPTSLSLRQIVYEKIKYEIISCKLAPGEPLSESQFVDRFQVSKTPIREALTSLQQDHLVEYIPNRGFMVTTISLRDIQEIFEARLYYEVTLFELAMKRISPAEIDNLEAIAAAEYDWTNPNSVDTYLQDNLEFHLAIARSARNNRMYWQFTNLLDEAQRLMYMDFKENAIRPIWHRSHLNFVQALREKELKAGIAAIEASIENAKKRILGT